MDEVRTDSRPRCHWCLQEKRENPKTGILFMDLDGSGRKPCCGEHYEMAKENGRRAMIHGPAGGFGVKGQT